jgi:hypothetical protein
MYEQKQQMVQREALVARSEGLNCERHQPNGDRHMKAHEQKRTEAENAGYAQNAPNEHVRYVPTQQNEHHRR